MPLRRQSEESGSATCGFGSIQKRDTAGIVRRFLCAFIDRDYHLTADKKYLGEEFPVQFAWIWVRSDLENLLSVSERDSCFDSI